MAQKGCCALVRVREDNARFLLLAIVLIIYMFCGAALFRYLEQGAEQRERQDHADTYKQFLRKYPNVVETELVKLLYSYGNATAKNLLQDKRPRWDIRGAFYFVLTIVTTIGKLLLKYSKCYRKP